MLISDSGRLRRKERNASMLQSGGLAGLSRHAAAAAAAPAQSGGGVCGTRRAIATSLAAARGRRSRREEDSSNRRFESCGGLRIRGLSTTSLTMESAAMPSITLDNMNPAIKRMEYAVRGPLVIRATAIEKELEKVGMENLFFISITLDQ